MKTNKISFDDRIVDFKSIHGQKPEDLEKFIDIIDAQPGQLILDGMCGYGAISKDIIKTAHEKGFIPEIYTLDESAVQISRARNNLPDVKQDHILQADMKQTPFQDGMFDTVVIKMGVHELPKEDQILIFKEVYRILKKEGKLVIWDLSFHNSGTQKVFQDLIRKKDEIAGFDSLVEKRYLPRQDELIVMFEIAGFKNVSVAHEVDAAVSMRIRESELVSKDRKTLTDQKGTLTLEDEKALAELGKKRCDELITFAKKYMTSVSEDVKKALHYEETKDDIKIWPMKEIIVGYK